VVVENASDDLCLVCTIMDLIRVQRSEFSMVEDGILKVGTNEENQRVLKLVVLTGLQCLVGFDCLQSLLDGIVVAQQ
jgi:hypothetical protein